MSYDTSGRQICKMPFISETDIIIFLSRLEMTGANAAEGTRYKHEISSHR